MEAQDNDVLNRAQTELTHNCELSSTGCEEEGHYFRCNSCNYGSFTLIELILHKRHHESALECQYCLHTADSPTQLDQHSKIHAIESKLACGSCSYRTHSTSLLSLHNKTIHADSADKPQAGTKSNHGVILGQQRSCDGCGLTVMKNFHDFDIHHVVCKRQQKVHNKRQTALASRPVVSQLKGLQTKTRKTTKKPWWDTSSQLLPVDSTCINENEDQLGRRLIHCEKCDQSYNPWENHACEMLLVHTCIMCSDPFNDAVSLTNHLISAHTRIWNTLQVKTSLDLNTASNCMEQLIPQSYKEAAESVNLVSTESDPADAASSSLRSLRVYRCTQCYTVCKSAYLMAGHTLICTSTKPQNPTKCCDEVLDEWEEEDLLEHFTSRHTQAVDSNQLTSVVSVTTSSIEVRDEPISGVQASLSGPELPSNGLLDGTTRICDLCLLTFTSPLDLSHHILSLHASPEYLAKTSGYDATAVEMLEQYGCGVCDFISDDQIQLQDHMSNHTGATPYFCVECQARFSTAKNLQTHCTHKHPKPDEISTSKPKTNIRCPQCDYKTSSRPHLEKHMNSVHQTTSGEPTNIYVCPEKSCSFITETKDALTAHLSQPLTVANHCCHICGYITPNKYTLKAHIDKHEGKKRFKCDQCEFTTLHASSLTIHMRIHSGLRPFICSMCGKCFTTNSELNKHERRHAGLIEKKHKCDECDKAYASAQHLIVHKRKHSGDRPFKCEYCTFAATSKAVLRNHIPIHTGEKNYKCHLCPFLCTSSGTLSNHRKLKHKIHSKRKSLAETTPDSILQQAMVAGKSRRMERRDPVEVQRPEARSTQYHRIQPNMRGVDSSTCITITLPESMLTGNPDTSGDNEPNHSFRQNSVTNAMGQYQQPIIISGIIPTSQSEEALQSVVQSQGGSHNVIISGVFEDSTYDGQSMLMANQRVYSRGKGSGM